MAFLALLPGLGLLTCASTHVLMSRWAPTVFRVYSVMTSVCAGIVGLGLAIWLMGWAGWLEASVAELRSLVAVWVLTYFALAYYYVFGFYNLGESARRIRLLMELCAAGERGLSIGEILAAYNARLVVEARLQRLLACGQIVERDGRYVGGKPLMLRLAKTLVLLKLIYFGAPSEFAWRPTSRSAGAVDAQGVAYRPKDPRLCRESEAS